MELLQLDQYLDVISKSHITGKKLLACAKKEWDPMTQTQAEKDRSVPVNQLTPRTIARVAGGASNVVMHQNSSGKPDLTVVTKKNLTVADCPNSPQSPQSALRTDSKYSPKSPKKRSIQPHKTISFENSAADGPEKSYSKKTGSFLMRGRKTSSLISLPNTSPKSSPRDALTPRTALRRMNNHSFTRRRTTNGGDPEPENESQFIAKQLSTQSKNDPLARMLDMEASVAAAHCLRLRGFIDICLGQKKRGQVRDQLMAFHITQSARATPPRRATRNSRGSVEMLGDSMKDVRRSFKARKTSVGRRSFKSFRKSSKLGRGQPENIMGVAKSASKSKDNVIESTQRLLALSVKPNFLASSSPAQIPALKLSNDTSNDSPDAESKKLMNQTATAAANRWRRAKNAHVAGARFAKLAKNVERRRSVEEEAKKKRQQELAEQNELFAEADAGSEMTLEQLHALHLPPVHSEHERSPRAPSRELSVCSERTASQESNMSGSNSDDTLETSVPITPVKNIKVNGTQEPLAATEETGAEGFQNSTNSFSSRTAGWQRMMDEPSTPSPRGLY